MTNEDIMNLLNGIYDKTLVGIPKVSPPVYQMAEDYISKNNGIESAAKSLINYQVVKCTTSGFLTSLGGFLTMPVAIPANLGSVIYVQMRMIACLAYMGGYDVESDQVQTMIYACLAGISVDQLFKKMGVQFGTKLSASIIKKIPGKALTKINQKVGFRFITKAGSKGIVNLTKVVPFVGGIVGGSMDLVETKMIAKRAYKLFIEGDWHNDGKSDDTEVIDITDDDMN